MTTFIYSRGAMFIGHTRFSLFMPGATSWKASRGNHFETEEEYRDYLFSDERLGIRAKLFFDFSLPQLARAAEGHDVTHVVSYSETLPSLYQNQLRDAAEEFSFVKLDKVQTGGDVLSRYELAARKAGGREVVFADYRLDDDDILATDYFERLSPYAAPPFAGMVISFGSGVTAVHVDGKFYDVRLCKKPMIAIGLSRMCHVDRRGHVTEPALASSHVRADEYAPVVLDSRSVSYVWTRHETQDTDLARYKDQGPAEKRERLRNRIDRLPLVEDMTDVAKAFPYVATSMSSNPDDFPR